MTRKEIKDRIARKEYDFVHHNVQRKRLLTSKI